MGRQGRQRVEEQLAWAHQQQAYLAVFDELTHRAPAPIASSPLTPAGLETVTRGA
jgi:hypothetical protein